MEEANVTWPVGFWIHMLYTEKNNPLDELNKTLGRISIQQGYVAPTQNKYVHAI